MLKLKNRQCKKKSKADKIECVDVVENKIKVSQPHKKQKVQDEQNDVGVVDTPARMVNKIIDRVNNDCLAQIFMNIPPFERPKVAQVCKKWKEALPYSWSNVKKLECKYWEYDGDISEEKSEKPRCLKGLINQCGRYLTELNIMAYDNSDVMPLIKRTCPQVVALYLRFANVKNVHFRNAFSYMSKLYVLKIIFHCDSSIPTLLIDSLKDVAGTLHHLTFFNWKQTSQNQKIPDIFTTVFPQMSALKYFDLFGFRFPDE